MIHCSTYSSAPWRILFSVTLNWMANFLICGKVVSSNCRSSYKTKKRKKYIKTRELLFLCRYDVFQTNVLFHLVSRNFLTFSSTTVSNAQSMCFKSLTRSDRIQWASSALRILNTLRNANSKSEIGSVPSFNKNSPTVGKSNLFNNSIRSFWRESALLMPSRNLKPSYKREKTKC